MGVCQRDCPASCIRGHQSSAAFPLCQGIDGGREGVTGPGAAASRPRSIIFGGIIGLGEGRGRGRGRDLSEPGGRTGSGRAAEQSHGSTAARGGRASAGGARPGRRALPRLSTPPGLPPLARLLRLRLGTASAFCCRTVFSFSSLRSNGNLTRFGVKIKGSLSLCLPLPPSHPPLLSPPLPSPAPRSRSRHSQARERAPSASPRLGSPSLPWAPRSAAAAAAGRARCHDGPDLAAAAQPAGARLAGRGPRGAAAAGCGRPRRRLRAPRRGAQAPQALLRHQVPPPAAPERPRQRQPGEQRLQHPGDNGSGGGRCGHQGALFRAVPGHEQEGTALRFGELQRRVRVRGAHPRAGLQHLRLPAVPHGARRARGPAPAQRRETVVRVGERQGPAPPRLQDTPHAEVLALPAARAGPRGPRDGAAAPGRGRAARRPGQAPRPGQGRFHAAAAAEAAEAAGPGRPSLAPAPGRERRP